MSTPPSPSRKPATTKRAVSERNERFATDDNSAPTTSNPPSTAIAVSKRCTQVGSQNAHHGPRQVAVVAGRGRGVQRISRAGRGDQRAPRLRQRRVRQAAPAARLRQRRRGGPQPPA